MPKMLKKKNLKQTVQSRKKAEALYRLSRNELESRERGPSNELVQANILLTQEIENRKKIERTLRESEKKYRLLADNVSDVIWILDIESFKYIYVSPSVMKQRGYTPEEAMKIPLQETLTPPSYELSINLLAGELKNDLFSPAERSRTIEVEQFRKDGSSGWVEITVRFLRNSKGRPTAILGVSRDITERKQITEQLLQTKKLAALGNLVAGVAHEISTPLGAGVMAASYLNDILKEFSDRLPPATPVNLSEIRKYTKIAGEASSQVLSNLIRAAELLNSFKQVAVDQSGNEKRLFSFKTCLDETLISLRPEYQRMRHKISIQCPENLEIISSPGAFSQIITNLFMNSLIHGFDGIETGAIRIRISAENNNLLLFYQDNGVGMDKNNLEKIFDPFFTTKRNQGGMGLGMHIVYNLVTQTLKGRIDCKSSPGNGVEFKIKVPLES
ncbi:MAG: PAS domain S-box protein [Desulfobacterales bacterium]